MKKCKILSLILSLCIISTSTSIVAFASPTKTSSNNLYESETLNSKKSIINELYKLGFTDKEIEELFEEFPYDESIPLIDNTISSNKIYNILRTSPGDTKNSTYYISTNWVKGLGYSISIGSAGLGLSKAEWAKILVKKMGWKVTVLVGAIASAVADMAMGPNGVRIEMIYTWSYGDTSMAWYWAPTAFDTYKY